MNQGSGTIDGRLQSVTGKAEVSGVEIWFAYRTVGGEESTTSVQTSEDGTFTLALPEEALDSAQVGARVEGASVVDLEPGGGRLEPGDLVLIVDDIVPSHLRHGGL